MEGDTASFDAIESERRRLARSLNDGPALKLSNVVLRAQTVERLLASDAQRAGEEAQRLRDTALAALADVRRFMFEAYPSVLDDLGLVETVRRYLGLQSDRSLPAVALTVEGDEHRLPPPVELALFRAMQDMLRAAERQPSLREPGLTIVFHPDATELSFTATGWQESAPPQGADGAGTETSAGGTSAVRRQLMALGGSFTARHEPEAETALVARVPA